MKTDNRTNYIDKNGMPRGDWCKIIGQRLMEWNAANEHARNTEWVYANLENLKTLCNCTIINTERKKLK